MIRRESNQTLVSKKLMLLALRHCDCEWRCFRYQKFKKKKTSLILNFLNLNSLFIAPKFQNNT